MKKNKIEYDLASDVEAEKTTYKKLQKEVTKILRGYSNKYVCFSIFESIRERGDTWYVKAPNLLSHTPVFLGHILLPCGHTVYNPTWNDIIKASVFEAGEDHCYLESVSVVNGKLKFCFGS